ncbi:hypothetical protein ISN34_07940 [Xanthomonas translucens pv. translucens]|uniref:Uncharacterized protein n=1 Tax=Xanthomonas translucens pv. translucens TaxID=134875 RepID=A0ABW9KZL0_XANCT|nr:hypothetical protein [Xanthomonas translucens]QSQ35840.1 hypothetical protein ISN31_10180 [Xanthomonas translucens pv. translucens]QSQ46752.1 hypothetical protein ISN34_07940 [Xanthomonas translucens pv. translucens]
MDANDQDEIPFDITPPVYGPELPHWWQLALAGYEVACHEPKNGWRIDSYRWCPERPPQIDGDWLLVAIGLTTYLLEEHWQDDGQVECEWEHCIASFWARRPPGVDGPTARTFAAAEVKRDAWSDPIERESESVWHMLAVYQGDNPEAL